MGIQLPLPKRGQSPHQFSAHVYCGQTAGWIKMALGMEVVLGPGQIVLDGEPPPLPPKGGTVPRFLAHFYCGQMAGCIKIPLGIEVGLDPGHIVQDGNPAPPKGQAQTPRPGGRTAPRPIFGRCLLWPNGWMDQDATWYEHRPRSRRHCYMGTQLPKKEGDTALPNFPLMSVVAKRLYASVYHFVRR